jgi:hypothetical protein
MQPASQLDGFEFAVFPPRQDDVPATEVDIGRGETAEALVVTAGVGVSNELGETRVQLTWQLVVLERQQAKVAANYLTPVIWMRNQQ